MDGKGLWEILVPRFSNEGVEYEVAYHHGWDEQVRDIAGGLTILRTARGQWLNPVGRTFDEEMIPVRIHCSEPQIDEIMGITLDYYKQEAVFAYLVSEQVKVLERK